MWAAMNSSDWSSLPGREEAGDEDTVSWLRLYHKLGMIGNTPN